MTTWTWITILLDEGEIKASCKFFLGLATPLWSLDGPFVGLQPLWLGTSAVRSWKIIGALTGRRMKKRVTPPTSGASPISGSKMTLIIPLSWKIQDSFNPLVNTYDDDDDYKVNAENSKKARCLL